VIERYVEGDLMMKNLMNIIKSGKDLKLAIVQMSRKEVLEQLLGFEQCFKLDFTSEFLADLDDAKLQHILYGAWSLIEFKFVCGKDLQESIVN